MIDEQPKFHVADGFLCGPTGRWQLSAIKASYKRESGRLDFKKWLASVTGATAAVVLASTNPVGAVAAAAVGFGYLSSRTMRVYALIDGQEIELLAEPFLHPFWRVEAANKACDELLSLIAKEQKRST
jgi:hypothetical protein